MRSRRWLPGLALIAALVALLAVIYFLLLSLPTRVYEAGDFLGYWSGARLLAQGQNLYDPDAVLALQREQGWPSSRPVYLWNPPWLYLVLLPLGVLPFRQAAALWFLINPLLIGASALILWNTISERRGLSQLGLALLATFLLSRSLHAMLVGQINTLVLFGCVGFLFLAARRRDLLAGALLVLVTVKPLAYLLLPALLWTGLLRGRWRIVLAFWSCLILLMLLATLFYPAWVGDYLSLYRLPASPENYPIERPPTIRGFVLARTGFDVGLWPAIICLIGFLIFIPLRGRSLDLPTIASLSFIVGLPAAPMGWSTDQIVLLLPILQILAWMPRMAGVQRWVAAVSLALIYGCALLVWVVAYRDAYFVVLPLAVGLVWLYSRWRKSGNDAEIC